MSRHCRSRSATSVTRLRTVGCSEQRRGAIWTTFPARALATAFPVRASARASPMAGNRRAVPWHRQQQPRHPPGLLASSLPCPLLADARGGTGWPRPGLGEVRGNGGCPPRHRRLRRRAVRVAPASSDVPSVCAMRRACCPRASAGPATTAVLAALVTAEVTAPVTPSFGAGSVELPVLMLSAAPGGESVATSARSAEAELWTARAPLTKGVDRLGGRLRPAGASEVPGGQKVLHADVTQVLYEALHCDGGQGRR